MVGSDENEPKSPRRTTAQMVADKAGVSRSAVSRAFTEGRYVDAEKRARIYEVASELGYQPNALAASLQGGRSHLVAVIAGEVRNPHDTTLITRLCEVLNENGLWPLLVTGGKNGSSEKLDETLRFPLDALVIRGGSMSDSFVEQCAKLSIPMICYGRPLEAGNVDAVYCRNYEGMKRITSFLIGTGRRRFGYIAGPDGFYSSHERRRGMLDALQEHDLTIQAEIRSDYTVEGGYAAARQLLGTLDRPDALVCTNDATAIGALTAVRDMGINVPSDMAVTGFDDIEMSNWPMFSLTTLRNPLDQTVSALVDRVKIRLESANEPGQIVDIDPTLILRGTH